VGRETQVEEMAKATAALEEAAAGSSEDDTRLKALTKELAAAEKTAAVGYRVGDRVRVSPGPKPTS